MKKIVLIEDNSDVRETTKEILELADYHVICTSNGIEGVECAKEVKPDLIICDIMMPELDGYGVLRILSRNPNTSAIPFIFLTSKSEKDDFRKGMNLGADDYIIKPFEETTLLEAVEIRLNRSLILRNFTQLDGRSIDGFINEVRGVEEMKNLSRDRKVKAFKNRETVYREGDYANYLYFIERGQVKTFKTDNYAKDFVSHVYGQGEFFGYLTLLEDREYHETAVSIDNTHVSVIPKNDFKSLIYKNKDVSANFIKMLAGNVQEHERRMLKLAYSTVRERVAEALLMLQKKQTERESDQHNIVVSRESLAGIVGTARESLNRTISELKRDQLIDTEGRSIRIINKSGLLKAASGF